MLDNGVMPTQRKSPDKLFSMCSPFMSLLNRFLLTTKSVWLVLCIGCLLTACVSNYIAWNTNSNIKKIALGMSKEQVTKILGRDYLAASSSRDERGNQVDIIAYKSAAYEEYRLRFVNNLLTEWNREFTNKYIVKDPSP